MPDGLVKVSRNPPHQPAASGIPAIGDWAWLARGSFFPLFWDFQRCRRGGWDSYFGKLEGDAIPVPAIAVLIRINLSKGFQQLGKRGEAVGAGIGIGQIFLLDSLAGKDFQPPHAGGKGANAWV